MEGKIYTPFGPCGANCDSCPYNEDMDHGPDRKYPCGQQNCWYELADEEEVTA